tara:strand:- start:276 stop:449 length:174 start_codon:yes stop_codon:yes gene_type:complete
MIDIMVLFAIVYLFFMIYCFAELRGLRKYIETSNARLGKYTEDIILHMRKGKNNDTK